MNWLDKGYTALVGDRPPQQSGPELVDKLCDRVVHSTLLEDRRAAVMGLKNLSKSYQLEVGTKGMPILLHMLKQDRADTEVTKAILDTLINTCSIHSESKEQDLGMQFTEIFVKDSNNVSLLLEILGETDFHIRYTSIEFMKILLRNKRKALQDCILTSPMGVSRLMDLVSDHREVVRNDGLLLLIDLTAENADIQKIIAFENAFERLLQIIYDEDACDGDMIVQDCFHLMYNLLCDNVSNQNYFRESGLILRLSPFFKLQLDQEPDQFYLEDGPEQTPVVWSNQRVRNMDAALDVLRIFLQEDNPNSPQNQKVMFQSQLLRTLLQLAIKQSTPDVTRYRCLLTAGDIVYSHREIQDFVTEAVVVAAPQAQVRTIPRPLVIHMLSMILENSSLNTKSFEFQSRCGALYFIRSFLSDNHDAQNFIISTMSSPPASNPNDQEHSVPVSAGSLLKTALFDWDVSRKDPFRTWFAAIILSHALGSNKKAKEIALKTTLGEEEHALDLLTTASHTLMVAAREDADIRLLEQMAQTTLDPTIQGLAAYLLGVCFEYNDDSIPSLSRTAIQSIVVNRVGADQYISRLNRLKESRAFSRYNHEDDLDGPDAKAGSLPDLFFDSLFVDLFKSSYGMLNYTRRCQIVVEIMQKSVVNPKLLKQRQMEKEENQQKETVITSYKKLIADQDAEMAVLKKRVAELELASSQPGSIPTTPAPPSALGDASAKDAEIVQLQTQVQVLQSEAQSWKEKYEATHQEMEDLLVCLAEQDMEVTKLKDRLRAHGEVFEDYEDEAEQAAE